MNLYENGYIELFDFYDNPNAVKLYAQKQVYRPCDYFNGTYIFSGFRNWVSDPYYLNLTKETLEKKLNFKIDHFRMEFVVNTLNSVCGGIHYDSKDPNDFAAVVYLNEIIPDNIDSGTTIYDVSCKDFDIQLDNYNNLYKKGSFYDNLQILYSVHIPSKNSLKLSVARDVLDFKSRFKVLANIKNEFNKLIIYFSEIPHSPNFYFGEEMIDSRLSISMFGKIIK